MIIVVNTRSQQKLKEWRPMIIMVLLLLVVAVVLIHGLISKAQSEQNARDELANCCQVDPSGRTPYQLANGETPHP